MNAYTARLMQESGVQGPTTQIEAESLEAAAAAARDWAEGQTGHPWDHLTVTDNETREVIEARE